MITFTDRELRRAWRENLDVSRLESPIENPKLLLLFYAAECGLKALVLKNDNHSLSEESPIISEAGHDLRGLMRYLRIDGQFRLPRHLSLPPIRRTGKNKKERGASLKDLNQVWRYGGKLNPKIKNEIQEELKRLNDWLKERLL